VVWLGLLLGTLFWALESHIRPVLVKAQVESGLGGYAKRFPMGWHEDDWIVRGDVAVRGDVFRADRPFLRDVLVFQGIRAPDLTEILGAGRMEPTDVPYKWRLIDVTRYDVAGGTDPVPHPDTVIHFDLIPAQLTYGDLLVLFLPNDVLAAYAAMPVPPEEIGDALTQRWRRATVAVLPFVIAFLAIGMANLGYEGRRILVPRLIGLAALGYSYVTAIKVVGRMGALDLMAPWIAVLGPLILSALLAAWLAWRQS